MEEKLKDLMFLLFLSGDIIFLLSSGAIFCMLYLEINIIIERALIIFSIKIVHKRYFILVFYFRIWICFFSIIFYKKGSYIETISEGKCLNQGENDCDSLIKENKKPFCKRLIFINFTT